ncbi:MAG: HAD hydrolase-like protein [Burkholderiales bacterium]|nr:HAD hydrolase-like protein [Burkholderiales bacterium]
MSDPPRVTGSGAADALLFDLDGTLTDNFTGIARSIVYALDHLGVETPTAAELRQFVGPPLRTTFAALLDTGESDAIEHAIALYRERYSDLGWRENVVYDGIPEALASLARTRRLFLCTAKPELYARRIVTLFGLSEFLDGVYGSELGGRHDDKAELLAHLAATERIDAARAVMIGDRSHDIRAARVNGARAVGVLWGYGSQDELAGADAIARTPAELPGVLEALESRMSAPG